MARARGGMRERRRAQREHEACKLLLLLTDILRACCIDLYIPCVRELWGDGVIQESKRGDECF